MKKTTTIILLFIGAASFAQSKDSTVKPVPVYIRSFYDTIPAKIYYEDGDMLKVYRKGSAVRHIETNSSDGTQNRILSILYYDEKMRPFKHPVFNVTPR